MGPPLPLGSRVQGGIMSRFFSFGTTFFSFLLLGEDVVFGRIGGKTQEVSFLFLEEGD